MLRSPRFQLLALIAGVTALVVIFFVRSDGASPSSSPVPATLVVAPEAAPSSANVDPTFHAQLMALRQQVDAAPSDTTLLLQLARLEQDAHQFAEAASTYERVLTFAPDHRQAYLDLALSYGQLGQWGEARAATERLLARDPDDPSALYNLGAIHANQGEAADARRLWTRVQQQSRDAQLAQQAAASLARLDALAAEGVTPSAPTPTPSLAPVRQPMSGAAPPIPPGAPLPADHPPIRPRDDFQPILAGQ
ncbi:MAG: tetratricopeptide repeat protein [Rhodothermaceae bacterium]|nr:tetratricopeptide repeat protein [Rhodothermaceae bacterium]